MSLSLAKSLFPEGATASENDSGYELLPKESSDKQQASLKIGFGSEKPKSTEEFAKLLEPLQEIDKSIQGTKQQRKSFNSAKKSQAISEQPLKKSDLDILSRDEKDELKKLAHLLGGVGRLTVNSEALSLVSGNYQDIDLSRVPKIISTHPFLTKAMSSEINQVLTEKKPLSEQLGLLGIDSKVITLVGGQHLKADYPVSLKNLLKSFGIDPQQVSAELSRIKDSLLGGGIKSYIEMIQPQAASFSGKIPTDKTTDSNSPLNQLPKKQSPQFDKNRLNGAHEQGSPILPIDTVAENLNTNNRVSLSNIKPRAPHQENLPQLPTDQKNQHNEASSLQKNSTLAKNPPIKSSEFIPKARFIEPRDEKFNPQSSYRKISLDSTKEPLNSMTAGKSEPSPLANTAKSHMTDHSILSDLIPKKDALQLNKLVEHRSINENELKSQATKETEITASMSPQDLMRALNNSPSTATQQYAAINSLQEHPKSMGTKNLTHSDIEALLPNIEKKARPPLAIQKNIKSSVKHTSKRDIAIAKQPRMSAEELKIQAKHDDNGDASRLDFDLQIDEPLEFSEALETASAQTPINLNDRILEHTKALIDSGGGQAAFHIGEDSSQITVSVALSGERVKLKLKGDKEELDALVGEELAGLGEALTMHHLELSEIELHSEKQQEFEHSFLKQNHEQFNQQFKNSQEMKQPLQKRVGKIRESFATKVGPQYIQSTSLNSQTLQILA